MTKLTEKQKRISSICKSIRESFGEAKIVYCYGGCYAFYKILKTIYPESIAYETAEGGHILTKIDDDYYDITGLCDSEQDTPSHKPLSEREHIQWDANVYGIRVEWMVKDKAKYRSIK